MKYYDVFAESGFHSAFLTTFAFGAQAFEDIPFSRLRGSGCRNITVLADRQMINQSFAEYGPPKFAGTSYHLVKADAPGAFHPKITLLIGEKKGKLLVGSANLTALGLGGNRELVASIVYTPETQGHARYFAEALTYIRRNVPEDDLWVSTAIQRALRAAPWLRQALEAATPPDETAKPEVALLLDRPGTTILDQIVRLVGDDPIERLIVVSPFWDTRLEGLARLRTALAMPSTDLLIEPKTTSFPKSELQRFSGVDLFDVDPSDSKRFVHAKLVVAQGRSWDHVISGSMNCTLPALIGPSLPRGNAEAGVYKRVPPGTAIEALGLATYRAAPVQLKDLLDVTDLNLTSSEGIEYADGGTITLQSGCINWTPPSVGGLRQAVELVLLDREGSPFRTKIDLREYDTRGWLIDVDTDRPKSAVVQFSDGTASAPVQIVDLDVLAVRTQPPAQGRKKSLTDILAEATDADLVIYEVYIELESLEIDENVAASELPGQAVSTSAAEPAAQNYAILPYEEFVRARTTVMAQGGLLSGLLHIRHDSAANTLSATLNRLIGLVGADLDAAEDKELKAIGAMDFRMTEPIAASDADEPIPQDDTQKPMKPSKQTLATAMKIQEAVHAFEGRCRLLKGRPIGTAELIRLRALLQIILSYAQPVRGIAVATQILPVHTKDGYDWPRLVGRLLRQHFGTARAIQSLRVEQDETEQKRVLEYLAMADWGAKAAVIAAKSNPKTVDLRVPLDGLAKALHAQVRLILGDVSEDIQYFEQLHSKLDESFSVRLGLKLPEAN
jgi:hypothetical protein